MVVLTALAVVSGIAVPPIVDRLRARAARQTEHQLLLAQRQEGAAAERAEQLRSHFRPRGRGVLPSSLREGSYFAGRVQVLSELTAWINTEGTDTTRSRVVTGAPGSGKSAVLGRLVSLADAQLRGETPIAQDQALPQIGALCAAVHVRGRTVDEVAAEISRALDIDESTAGGLLAHLRETREHRATVVVVDGVDEAVDAQRLIVDLLEPLAAASGRTGIRLLVGTRPGGEDDLLRLFEARHESSIWTRPAIWTGVTSPSTSASRCSPRAIRRSPRPTGPALNSRRRSALPWRFAPAAVSWWHSSPHCPSWQRANLSTRTARAGRRRFPPPWVLRWNATCVTCSQADRGCATC